MTEVKNFTIALSFLCLFAMASAQDKQNPSQAEIRSEVPELTEFHTVIFKLWHDAWPSGNVSLLRELSPKVREKADKVCAAKLPGILKEKQGAWMNAVDTLKRIVARYEQSAAAGDSIGLMDAAERLHRHFENMVRVIRPALKEVDAFHSVLYRIYHYYKPQKDIDQTRLAAGELAESMRALEGAALPQRFKTIDEPFRRSVKALGESVAELNSAVGTNDWRQIERKIEAVHTHFQSMNSLFD